MSRDITKATPYMRWFWKELQVQVKRDLKLNIFLVDVDRDWKVQRAYYAQGREALSIVNDLRKIVQLPLITEAQNKKKITWTLNSKHITNLEDDIAFNEFSRAIDIGLKDKDGRYIGDATADINRDGMKDYIQIGYIGERIGGNHIRWGGRFFSVKDLPHYEEV